MLIAFACGLNAGSTLEAIENGRDLDVTAFACGLKAGSTLEAIANGRDIHGCTIKKGLTLVIHVKCGPTEKGHKVFGEV